MIGHKFLARSVALALAFCAVPAAAQQVTLVSDVKVVTEVVENGQSHEALVEPTTVVPGDKLRFTTHFSNPTKQAATDLNIVNPLSKAVQLTDAGDFLVSVDGGTTFGPLAELTVTGADGKPRQAQLSDVTHLRWSKTRIEPGESGEAHFLAVVR